MSDSLGEAADVMGPRAAADAEVADSKLERFAAEIGDLVSRASAVISARSRV